MKTITAFQTKPRYWINSQFANTGLSSLVANPSFNLIWGEDEDGRRVGIKEGNRTMGIPVDWNTDMIDTALHNIDQLMTAGVLQVPDGYVIAEGVQPMQVIHISAEHPDAEPTKLDTIEAVHGVGKVLAGRIRDHFNKQP
jgi:hypothetical protein